MMNRTEPQSYQEFGSLPARVAGVVRSPRALLARVIERPAWADVLALSFAVSLACGVVFMMTGVGRQALVDQMERTAAAFGRQVDDAQYARFEEMSADAVPYAAARALLMGPVLALGAAAVLATVFGKIGGRGGTFRQALAVTSHAGVILAVGQLVGTPVNYARETLSSPAPLTIFVPMLDAASPVARFFGAIDLFVVWWLVVVALGAALLYRRPAPATALAFIGAYVGLAMLLAIAMVVSGGTV